MTHASHIGTILQRAEALLFPESGAGTALARFPAIGSAAPAIGAAHPPVVRATRSRASWSGRSGVEPAAPMPFGPGART